jgi:predicted aldo/keto reductase-like oxidoreductase
MRYQHGWKDCPWGEIPDDNQKNLEATIRRALDLGIRHIETARGYGTSEMQLGRILPKLPREEIIVQTKVVPSEDPAEFLATFEKSLGLLGLDHVDLLGIHGINNEEMLDWTLREGGCLDAAEGLRRDGRVRHIGFSTHGPTGVIVRAIESGRFDYVNLHWYWVNEFNWPAVEAATARDMGVFVISPNDKGGKLYEPPEILAELCRPLHPMQFNLLFCLARPEIHTLSIGAVRPSDFDCHIEAVESHCGEAAAEVVAPVAARLREEMERRLGADWVSGWWRGIPDEQKVPGHVNVHEILRLWTYAKGLDMVEFGKMRYNLLGNAGHWFPGVNAAEFDEAALLDTLSGSPFAGRIPEILREAHAMLFTEPKKPLIES